MVHRYYRVLKHITLLCFVLSFVASGLMYAVFRSETRLNLPFLDPSAMSSYELNDWLLIIQAINMKAPNAALALGLFYGLLILASRYPVAPWLRATGAITLTFGIFFGVPYVANMPSHRVLAAWTADDKEWDGRKAPGRNIVISQNATLIPGVVSMCDETCARILSDFEDATVTVIPNVYNYSNKQQSPEGAENFLFHPPEEAATFGLVPKTASSCADGRSIAEIKSNETRVAASLQAKRGLCIHQVETPAQLDLVMVMRHGYVSLTQGDPMQLMSQQELPKHIDSYVALRKDIVEVASVATYIRGADKPEMIHRKTAVTTTEMLGPLTLLLFDGATRFEAGESWLALSVVPRFGPMWDKRYHSRVTKADLKIFERALP